MIIFLSLKYITVFLFIELLIGYLKAFQLEMCVCVCVWGGGRGSDGKEYVHNGGL